MPRPKGSRNKWRPDILVKNNEKLQRKCVKLALAGDPTCMRIAMDRLYPRLRNAALPVQVESNSSDLSGQALAVTNAILSGKIDPLIGRDLLAAIADVARIREASEFEQRLQRLESTNPLAAIEESLAAQTAATTRLPLRSRKRRRNKECEKT